MEALGELRPFHFPIAFPEVFLRDRAGFDVILGNPPWEEARIEEGCSGLVICRVFEASPQARNQVRSRRFQRQRPDLEVAVGTRRRWRSGLRDVLRRTSQAWGLGIPTCFGLSDGVSSNSVRLNGGRIGVVLPGRHVQGQGD